MKIAAYIDINYSSGGGLYQSTGAAQILNKIESDNFKIEFCCTSLETQNYFQNLGIKSKIFDKNSFFNRLNFLLYKFKIVKKILRLLKIENVFEKFIKKNNFDLVVFIDPSHLATYCETVNFIFNVWEIAHKKIPFFPEYKNNSIDLKDKLFQYAANKSFNIIVDCKKSKTEFSKFYNCNSDKIKVLPLIPNFIFKEIKSTQKTSHERFNNLNLKKCFFFPAQFWAHKNHAYLVDAIAYLAKKGIKDYHCIFTGRNRGTLNFIKSKIEKSGVSKNFTIYEYLPDNEVIHLYKECFSVILPTFVGSTSLPLYEAFYFDKSIIYNSSILDEDLKDKVIDINVKDPKDLYRIIKRIENNDIEFSNIKKKAKYYIDKELNEKNLIKKYSIIFDEFYYFLNRYK